MLDWLAGNIVLIAIILGSAVVVWIIIRLALISLRGRFYEKSGGLVLRKHAEVLRNGIELECRYEKSVHERVEFSVFAPDSIVRDSVFILDVWAYLPSQALLLRMLTKELGRDKLLGKKHGMELERGSALSVSVEIADLDIDEPIDMFVWNGYPTNTSFMVAVPGNVNLGQHAGKVTVAYKGMVISKIPFILDVGVNEQKNYGKRSGKAFYPDTAFASYSSENREEVLARIQGMKKVAPELEVFFDVFSLRSGDNWREKLEEHVPMKDVFYLFWSLHAAKSKWVDREWRLALNKRGLNYIDPVPLEDVEQAPPPIELNALHFNDAYVAYMQYERLKKVRTETLIG